MVVRYSAICYPAVMVQAQEVRDRNGGYRSCAVYLDAHGPVCTRLRSGSDNLGTLNRSAVRKGQLAGSAGFHTCVWRENSAGLIIVLVDATNER